MKTLSLLSICTILVLSIQFTFGQIGINIDGSTPNPSSILDVKSSDKGMLVPRMTIGQRDAITNPADGLMVFCTNCGTKGSLSIFSAGIWQTFSPCTISAPAAVSNIVKPGLIIWNWNAVNGAEGYKWNMVDSVDSAIDAGTSLSYNETVSDCDTTFTRYIWSYNTCAASPVTMISQDIAPGAPESPTARIHSPEMFRIIWDWEQMTGATGYKWNLENNILTAVDMDSATTKLQTGLNCGSEYSCYVWSYNGCGHSAVSIFSQSTTECCGNDLTINHLASGGVAPENKTTTYGTVTNITGDALKCWIAGNLGADHQADSVNDATEASAGWYWQFNRKQGFKHDGTTRTPNTTWFPGILEFSDWIAVNDPCRLELGSNWRIPTHMEWGIIYMTGGWTDWNDAWDSPLKLHAAGFLSQTTGSLNSRGSNGNYWTSLSNGGSEAVEFYFDSVDLYMFYQGYNKSRGFSVRCIRE